MFNWLQNLLYNVGGGAKAENELAQQQRLRAEQEVQKQQQIRTMQSSPKGLPTPTYQQYQGIAPTTTASYAPPTTPMVQAAQQGAQPPPYAPNVVNQTVSYNGATWKGNPGTGWTMEAPSSGGGGGNDGGGGSGVDALVNAIVDPVSKALDSWRQKLEEFDKNNPFAFDEAQAKASAQERLNPYYDATLNEFLTGVRRSSARSFEDMTRTIGELNVDASKLSEKERLNTQEAIRSSEEGFAGAGLFFSGKRARATGMEEVQGGQTQEGIATALSRNLASSSRANTRTQEDLALQEARQKRLLEAERTTALETDISGQKKESAYRRGLEQLQFAGDVPGLNALDKMKLENEFMSGLR